MLQRVLTARFLFPYVVEMQNYLIILEKLSLKKFVFLGDKSQVIQPDPRLLLLNLFIDYHKHSLFRDLLSFFMSIARTLLTQYWETASNPT